MSGQKIKSITRNKKVHYNYFVEDTLEVGIELKGSEVKSLRAGDVSINEAFVIINEKGHLTLLNAHIKEFKFANIQNHDPVRTRRLLVRKKELSKLKAYSDQKGFTLMPLEMYFKGKWVKLKVGLCRGKKVHDKRDVKKERDARKQMDRVMKSFNKRS